MVKLRGTLFLGESSKKCERSYGCHYPIRKVLKYSQDCHYPIKKVLKYSQECSRFFELIGLWLRLSDQPLDTLIDISKVASSHNTSCFLGTSLTYTAGSLSISHLFVETCSNHLPVEFAPIQNHRS